MLELLLTSFPALIQYWRLRRRGEAITVWSMKTAVFLWAMMAFALFLAIFYFHPKTYAGIIPFRTVSVVSQTSGPVTEILVENGQRVRAGDLLFTIEDSAQRAALAEAEAALALLDAEELKAADARLIAQASVDEAVTMLARLREDLADAETLLERGVGTADAAADLRTAVASTEAQLRAAEAGLDLADVDIEEALPARRRQIEAEIEGARVALEFTRVHSLVDGTITQLALNVGSPATTIVLRPAMVIIPDRPEGTPTRIVAGFSQIARTTLHEGMPAEVACESNANLSFVDTIFPARVASVQPAIAQGQVIPSGDLLDISSMAERGTVLVYLELLHPEQDALLLDGSGCMVQTYTNAIPGFVGHAIAATGVVKAAGLRLKMLGAIIAGVGLSGGGH
jgi:multidrug resistance efflux pump